VRRDAVPSEARDASLTLGRTRWGGKGLLRGEASQVILGWKAPEGSPSILEGCLANARQDKEGGKRSGGASLSLGRTKKGRLAGRSKGLF